MADIDSVENKTGFFDSSVGIYNIIASDHMPKMRNNALVGNSGHCCHEGAEFEIDTFVSSVGLFDITASDRMEKMKNNVLDGNSGDCYNEVDMSDSEGWKP